MCPAAQIVIAGTHLCSRRCSAAAAIHWFYSAIKERRRKARAERRRAAKANNAGRRAAPAARNTGRRGR